MLLTTKDITRMSNNELNALICDCKMELEKRFTARREELIQAVCDAMNTLHQEFPTVELHMSYQCSECATYDNVDVMEHFCGGKKMTSKDFHSC